MNFRRFIFAILFISLGHSILGQAAIMLVTEVATTFESVTKDPCIEDKDSDCPEDEKALLQPSGNKEDDISATVITSDLECKSNSCTGVQCVLRSCGSGMSPLITKNELIFGPEILTQYFDYDPNIIVEFDPSPPIKPPIS